MWGTIQAPYLARVWEAMSANKYECHSRLPGLRNDPRVMLADILTPKQYHRLAHQIIRKQGDSPPLRPLWTVGDVVRKDGLGLRSISELTGRQVAARHNRHPCPHPANAARVSLTPRWYASLRKYLGYDTSKQLTVGDASARQRLSSLQPQQWMVALDRTTYDVGDVVCYWSTVEDPSLISLRAFVVRQTTHSRGPVALSELTPSHGGHRWQLSAGPPAWQHCSSTIRDPGLLPQVPSPAGAVAAGEISSLVWMLPRDLLPLVGQWDDTNDDADEYPWLVPHSICWLKHSYDAELLRRAEERARTEAGDTHPLRRIRSTFQWDTSGAIPSPNTDNPLGVVRIFSAGAAFYNPSTPPALGAAVNYFCNEVADSEGAASVHSKEALRIDISTRVDGGMDTLCASKEAVNAANLHGVALALRTAAALRNSTNAVQITVQTEELASSISKLTRKSQFGRRRLLSDATDATNEIVSYHEWQKRDGLPAVSIASGDSSKLLGLQGAIRRAQLAANTEFQTGRAYPPASDWCIIEHNGDRVTIPLRTHFSRHLAISHTVSWSSKTSQGRILRIAPYPLPISRRIALNHPHTGLQLLKPAFRAISMTNVTLRELHCWYPDKYPSDICHLAGCDLETPDNQDHALLTCPFSGADRGTLLDTISSALCSLGPPSVPYWLALPAGPRLGKDRLRTVSIAAFATTAVASVLVDGTPLALLRGNPDPTGLTPHPNICAIIRWNAPQTPPFSATAAELRTWCSREQGRSAQWIAFPEQVLQDAVFRWQAIDEPDGINSRSDSLLSVIGETIRLMRHDAASPWPSLHHSCIDILMDSLDVRSCISPCSLLAPRRAINVVLAPGVRASPIDPLVGTQVWSICTLKSAAAHGILILLPHTSTAALAYRNIAHLLRMATPHTLRCATIIPWDPSMPHEMQQRQLDALSDLCQAGFTIVASLPPQLVIISQLNSFGPLLFTHNSSSARCPHVLLCSWDPSPHAIATALAALGALAQLKASQASYPYSEPLSQMPAWHLEHSITDRAEQIACLTCLTSSDLLVSRVIGPRPFVFSVVDRHQALRSSRPENILFPHLFDPLQPTAEPTTWQTTNYAGASLDDDAQAGPESSCDKLQCTTLHTLAAGILPAALHTVIGPWIHRRRLSAHRKSNTAKPLVSTSPPTLHTMVKWSSEIMHSAGRLWKRRLAHTFKLQSHIRCAISHTGIANTSEPAPVSPHNEPPQPPVLHPGRDPTAPI